MFAHQHSRIERNVLLMRHYCVANVSHQHSRIEGTRLEGADRDQTLATLTLLAASETRT